LLRRSDRARAGAFLVEGAVPVREALVSGSVKDLFVDAEASFAAEFLKRGGIAVSGRVIAALTDTATPQGVVAVAEARTVRLAAVEGDLVVVLADVRDPGNAGTLVRSAVAAGAGAVVFATGAVDPFNPKTVRATAGLLFHVGLVTDIPLRAALEGLGAKGFLLVGADAGAQAAASGVDLQKPVALVLGNESWGIDPSARRLLDEVIGIAMPGPAESLNVGIAGSILLFEVVRLRAREQEGH